MAHRSDLNMALRRRMGLAVPDTRRADRKSKRVKARKQKRTSRKRNRGQR